MRHLRYFYGSYMENKHGFFTFVPYAQILHPYFGLKLLDNGSYASFVNNYCKRNFVFSHKVKIFFPDVKEGFIYLDDIKYSAKASPKDDVKINVKDIVKDSPYMDYILIKNHLAEFEVVLEIDTKYYGVFEPIEVNCDYIDFLIGVERGTISLTTNSIKIIPYLYAYKTNLPPYYLEYPKDTLKTMANQSLSYTIVFPEVVKNALEQYKVNYSTPLAIFDLRGPSTELISAEFNAYELKYAEDIENYNNENIVPILSVSYGESSKQICENKHNSFWFTTVYDKNFESCDYGMPTDDMICNCKNKYSADDTRSYIAYIIGAKHKNDAIKLDEELKNKIGIFVYYSFYEYLNDSYVRRKDD